jgi:MFS transporter, MHS family, alpha-ketoglutarate permease
MVRGSLSNLIEWYDWYAYAAFSVYFTSVFFPSGNQTAQLLNTTGVFAVGFLLRPLGRCSAGTPTGSGDARR